MARELIRYGGAANLAETDELIGAEPYMMLNVRDADTAATFLTTIERFQERVAWHGHSAAGNPSGGNKYRGLYNIVLKSIGAAMKRQPDVRLDHVIPYSAPMKAPGYYFMDSPGNDLESIAGQVASGCNMIYFVTGNGSITNFPFVPTIKIVTTTRRYELLSRDMDVNAGRYLDGMPMDELGVETLELTRRAASGERTVGEKAGHAQVQLWRDWRQTEAGHVEEISSRPQPVGRALPLRRRSTGTPSLSLTYTAFADARRACRRPHRPDPPHQPLFRADRPDCGCTPEQQDRAERDNAAPVEAIRCACTYRGLRLLRWTYRRSLRAHGAGLSAPSPGRGGSAPGTWLRKDP